MSILNLIEVLANIPHHHPKIDSIINGHPKEVIDAFLTNNADLLKKQFSNTNYLADSVKVVQE